MVNKRLLVCVLAVLAVTSVGFYLTASRFHSPPTINVLLITLDTTRADRLGCYRYDQALTPALDELAAQGVLFEKAYSPAPLTLPAHATMFTGLYPMEHGLRTNGRGRLDASIPTLPELAAKSGYDTGAFVASFVVDSKFGLERGFQVYDDDLSTAEAADEAIHRQRDGRIVVDAALSWLKRPRENAFFCWIHLYDPHFPYLDRKAEFGNQFEGRPYDAEIAYTDTQIARLLAYLKSAGLDDRTLVIAVGDHGESLGEHNERTHGYTLYNATQRVPFIMRWPGMIEAGRRSSAGVSLVDLTPTLIDLLGLRNTDAMTGRSLRSDLSSKGTSAADDMLCFSATDDPFLQNGWSPLQSLVVGNWKFIRTTKPELYNLQQDPGELHNLVAQEQPRLTAMERQLEDLQGRLIPRKTTAVQLSANERRALEGLGYIGGRNTDERNSTNNELPDVKDMLPFDMAAHDALELLRSGKVEPAITRLKEIVSKSPRHIAARIFLGEALQHQGQLPEAISQYQQALQIKPDDPNALIHLGTAYIEQRRIDEAIAQFDEAVRVDPESSTAHYNLGLALVKLGQLHEAIEHYREAIRHDEAFANANTALGNALIAAEQSDEAIRCFQQELKIQPLAVDARINLAVLLHKTAPEVARKYLLEAVKIEPSNPQAQYNLGTFLLNQGDAQGSIGPLTESLRLAPTHPRARTELERAQKQLADQKP